jgi:ABC-2 type transport system ATP-binding protein
VHDGSLAGVIDRFSDYKVLTLQFADERMPGDLARFGEVLELAPPRVRIRVDRDRISGVLSTVLAKYAIQDVSVEDPPLEEVIAGVFAMSAAQERPSQAVAEQAAEVAAAAAK